jgi:hypothetical protein
LRGLDAKVLVMAAQLFAPRIKHGKIVDDFQKPFWVAQLQDVAVEGFPRLAWLFPRQKIAFGGFNRAVPQALAGVARVFGCRSFDGCPR